MVPTSMMASLQALPAMQATLPGLREEEIELFPAFKQSGQCQLAVGRPAQAAFWPIGLQLHFLMNLCYAVACSHSSCHDDLCRIANLLHILADAGWEMVGQKKDGQGNQHSALLGDYVARPVPKAAEPAVAAAVLNQTQPLAATPPAPAATPAPKPPAPAPRPVRTPLYFLCRLGFGYCM